MIGASDNLSEPPPMGIVQAVHAARQRALLRLSDHEFAECPAVLSSPALVALAAIVIPLQESCSAPALIEALIEAITAGRGAHGGWTPWPGSNATDATLIAATGLAVLGDGVGAAAAARTGARLSRHAPPASATRAVLALCGAIPWNDRPRVSAVLSAASSSAHMRLAEALLTLLPRLQPLPRRGAAVAAGGAGQAMMPHGHLASHRDSNGTTGRTGASSALSLHSEFGAFSPTEDRLPATEPPHLAARLIDLLPLQRVAQCLIAPRIPSRLHAMCAAQGIAPDPDPLGPALAMQLLPRGGARRAARALLEARLLRDDHGALLGGRTARGRLDDELSVLEMGGDSPCRAGTLDRILAMRSAGNRPGAPRSTVPAPWWPGAEGDADVAATARAALQLCAGKAPHQRRAGAAACQWLRSIRGAHGGWPGHVDPFKTRDFSAQADACATAAALQATSGSGGRIDPDGLESLTAMQGCCGGWPGAGGSTCVRTTARVLQFLAEIDQRGTPLARTAATRFLCDRMNSEDTTTTALAVTALLAGGIEPQQVAGTISRLCTLPLADAPCAAAVARALGDWVRASRRRAGRALAKVRPKIAAPDQNGHGAVNVINADVVGCATRSDAACSASLGDMARTSSGA